MHETFSIPLIPQRILYTGIIQWCFAEEVKEREGTSIFSKSPFPLNNV